MHGRPCIRGLRITVADILGLMSAGQSRETVIADCQAIHPTTHKGHPATALTVLATAP